jgi:hypothetical protein
MNALAAIDASVPTRDLVRILRVPPDQSLHLPESILWRAFIELRRRGEPQAASHFISGLRSSELAMEDTAPDEHRLAADPYLAELWRSYKRCLCANRTGPAAQLLREVEQQLQAD